MSFRYHKTKVIKVDHEDEEWIYLSAPDRVRVNKKTHAIEKLYIGGDYAPAKFTTTGSSNNPYPAISINCELWSVPRILATLFIPNPNGYKYIRITDPSKLEGIKWVERMAMGSVSSNITDAGIRKEVLGDLKAGSKEYIRRYNKIKGVDGLTNTQRYVKRKKDLGLVLLHKIHSPTGRSAWIDPQLREDIKQAWYTGDMEKPEVREALKKRVLEQPRVNKNYKEK